MSTYSCKRGSTVLSQSVFAPMFTVIDTQTATAQNAVNAKESKVMLETGLDKKYGGKLDDVYTFAIDDVTVYKVTRKELIAYCDAVIAFESERVAYETKWASIRTTAQPFKVADKPKVTKGDGTRAKVEKVA